MFLRSVFSLTLAIACFSATAVTVRAVGPTPVAVSGDLGASELSDLAFTNGNWYAVGDQSNSLYSLGIAIDSTTGQVVGSPTVGSSVSLLGNSGAPFGGGQDFEGLSDDGAGGLLISGEASNSLYRYGVGGGMAVEIVQPSAFSTARGNLGLEAVTASNGVVWTANEEALSTDGPTASSPGVSTLVRLQQLDSALSAVSQFAYAVDAIPGIVVPQSRSGVSGLLLLPNNELLVLERRTEIDFPNGQIFVNSLYRVDFSGADDTTLVAMLDNTVNTVTKDLLWTGRFDDDNFEGLALGPQLDSGETSLLLISDNGGGQNQSLFALAAADIGALAVPLPGSVILLMLGLVGLRRASVGRLAQ